MTAKSSSSLWILVGLPGSGKSTWAASFCDGPLPLHLISTDHIRAELFGDEAHQGPWPLIWAQVNARFHNTVLQTQQGTLAGAVYDATNAQRRGRREVIQAARSAGFDRVLALWFDTPIALCLLRNHRRSRQVPPEIIERMARQLVGAPPNVDEGFDAVYRLRIA
jgi:predicted kinase